MKDILVIVDLFMYTIGNLGLYDCRSSPKVRSAIDLICQYGPYMEDF